MNLPELDSGATAFLDSLGCHCFAQRGDAFVWANDRARQALGLPPIASADDEAIDIPVAQVMLGAFPPLTAEDAAALEASAASRSPAGAEARGDAQAPQPFECVLMGADGVPRNIVGSARLGSHRGSPARLVLAIERTGGLYDEMRGHATFLEELLDSAPEAIAIVHRGRILHVNHEFTQLFGYPAQQAVGCNLDDLILPDGHMHESEILLQSVEETERAYMETVRRTKDGHIVDVSVLVAPVRIGGNEVGHFVSYRDIRLQKQTEARLQHDALHDSLTGLANRVLFLDRLQLTMTRMVRRPDLMFAIMFLDLDGFKRVNDTQGHAAGDALLVKMAGRLQSCLRPQDTIARLGGDEFAILLDEILSPSDATGVAERIQQSVGHAVEIFGQHVAVSVSVGIALGSTEYASAEEIMRDADYAMYRAKANGKGRHEIFDKSMYARAAVRQQMEAQLRHAIENDEFEAWFQPVYRMADGSLESVEALLRWHHPEKGYIPIGEFLRLAEDSGLILPIGEAMLAKACGRAKQWMASHADRHLCVNVNLSPREFSHPGLLAVVEGVLGKTGLPASRLRLEITEKAVNQDPDAAVIQVQRLSDIGVEVALDNFGAGLASMNNLLRLPIQKLKLDRRLVSYLPAQGRQAALIETIFGLGRLMQMRMQADGIETEAQFKALERYGCELGQGHLFCAACPADEMDLKLASKQTPFGRPANSPLR